MSELKRAIEWLKTGQYLVKHDEMSYSVRVTDFAEETDELRKVLLDALRWTSCAEKMPTEDDADENGYVLTIDLNNGQETLSYDSIEIWNATHSLKVTHWRPLPAPPESEG